VPEFRVARSIARMEALAPGRLAVLVVVVLASTLITIREWVRQRREAAAWVEVQREAHRRVMLLGALDPADEALQSALVSSMPATPRLLRLLRPVLVGSVVTGFVVVAALIRTSDGVDRSAAPTASLEATTVAASEPPTPVGTAAGPAPVAVGAMSTPMPIVSATPPPSTPSTSPPQASTAEADALVIANTGGLGVWVRSACRDDALTGDAWAEGQLVEAVATEDADCVGWRLVEVQGASSWIEERYLQPAPPSAGP
jgi:hypothetical protein